jgi:predicted ferric reductase
MTDGPLLWYVNRATGVVLLLLLTLTVVLGVLSVRGSHGRRLPAFVTQDLHRNLALLGVVMLGVHIASAVVDSYVDIRWWQALVPAGATYEPVWLGLGALAFDVLLVLVVTSLARTRLGHRSWRAVHLSAWVAWCLSVVHGIGIGTDLRQPGGLAVLPTLGCCVAVLAAFIVRASWARRPEPPHSVRSVA